MIGPSVDMILLRGLLPDVPLRPGQLVHGRVLDARTLILEGVRMQAVLPETVQPGQRLRMRVEQATGDRLQLKIVAEVTAPQPGAPAARAEAPAETTTATQISQQAYALALPGGVAARVHVDPEGQGAGDGRETAAPSVVVRYDSPTIGRLDIRLDGASAAIHVAAGEPADRVRGAAADLRAALEALSGRETQVTVHPRLETFDARA